MENKNEISISLEYARRKKLIRLKQNKIHRQKFRSKFISNSFSSDPLDVEQSIENRISSINLALDDREGLIEDILCVLPTTDNQKGKETSENHNSSPSAYEYPDFNDICRDKQIPDICLHPYTNHGRVSFIKDLIRFLNI